MKKTLPAFLAAMLITLFLGGGMLMIGQNALGTTVAAAAPAVNLSADAATQIEQALVQYQMRETEYRTNSTRSSTRSTLPTSNLLQSISSLLALDNVHLWWYISRAAGMMGYLLTWLSTLWGCAVGSKVFDSVLERVFTFDFHEHLSWLGLGFIGFHAIALLFDHV